MLDSLPEYKPKDREVIEDTIEDVHLPEAVVMRDLTQPIENFKKYLKEVKNLGPFLEYKNIDDLKSSPIYKLLALKYLAILAYCSTTCAYFIASKALNPMSALIDKYQSMLDDIEKIQSRPEISSLIKNWYNKFANGERISLVEKAENTEGIEIDLDPKPVKKRLKSADNSGRAIKVKDSKSDKLLARQYGDLKDPEDEEEEMDGMLDMDDEDGMDGEGMEDLGGDEFAEDPSRPITYQIAKNKGLIPKRKKEQRNPRVKHKMKFKRALARRKGQVKKPIKEIKKYGGEISGIRSSVVKSIKFK